MSTYYKQKETLNALSKLVFLVPEVSECPLGLWCREKPSLYCYSDLAGKIAKISGEKGKYIVIDGFSIDIERVDSTCNFPDYKVKDFLDGVFKVFGN